MMTPISGGTPGPSISTTESFIYCNNTVLQLLGIEKKPTTSRRFRQTYAGKLIRGANM